MGPCTEQLVTVKAKLRFCPQPDKSNTYFPSSLLFPTNKEDKENSEEA